MAYNFTDFKNKIKNTEEWLKKEFSYVRTGRATPNLLDGVMVESYGAKVPLSGVGSISIEDARTIRITPWDMSQGKHIELAIAHANLGVSPIGDDKGVRVVFPELTEERRMALVKIAKQKMEEARISLRTERDTVWNQIQEGEKEGTIREDEKFRLKTEMQKMVDDANAKYEEMLEKKEAEITS